MSSLLSSVFVQVGLISLAVFYLLETFKPELLYDQKSGQPKYEILTPVSLAALAGLAWLLYRKRSGGSMMQALEVKGMPLTELDGFVVPDQSPVLPPNTFDST